MIDDYLRLFPEPSGFSEADYIGYLSPRLPVNLAQQLTHDAHPDLMLDDYVEVADLMRPLSAISFAASCDSINTKFHRLVWVLEYTVSGYARDDTKDPKRRDPYKRIYIASFYLYCCLRGPTRSSGYVGALLVLVRAAAEISLEGQLQVSRFIASLIPIPPGASMADPTPVSTAQLALSLIVANTASELSLLAEHAMREEHFAEAWTKKEEKSEEGLPSVDAMKMLRRIASAFFGASGKIEQIADRFRRLEDWNKSGS